MRCFSVVCAFSSHSSQGPVPVHALLDKRNERGQMAPLLDMLDLTALYDAKRDLRVLSGGEVVLVCVFGATHR